MKQFSVTVGSVFESSKVGLHLWLQATYLMSASKKGISSKQLERMLGVTYMIAKKARLMTDQAGVYEKIGPNFGSHEVVNHTIKEYARGDVTTNTVESSFAILKRGVYGTFHSVSEQHLQRYGTPKPPPSSPNDAESEAGIGFDEALRRMLVAPPTKKNA
ncbi:MAG: transposase [Pseudomonadota bacterium]|nr:transposase [Pseudomonadota bacterium]